MDQITLLIFHIFAIGIIKPNSITAVPNINSPDENRVKVKLNTENSFSKIQNSFTFATGKVVPKTKVKTSMKLKMTQFSELRSTLTFFFN